MTRVELLQSETVAHIPTWVANHAHTEVVIPRHLLCEHHESWVIEVSANAMYVAIAETETPPAVLARLGFEWEEDMGTAGMYVALDGVSFSKEDCRWWLSWDVPIWDLTRVLRFRHFRGNGGGVLTLKMSCTSSTLGTAMRLLWTLSLCTISCRYG